MNEALEGVCVTYYIYKEDIELKILGFVESTDGTGKEEPEPIKKRSVVLADTRQLSKR